MTAQLMAQSKYSIDVSKKTAWRYNPRSILGFLWRLSILPSAYFIQGNKLCTGLYDSFVSPVRLGGHVYQ